MTQPKRQIRILVVDDFEVVRKGLRAYFERERDFVVVGDAESPERALALLTKAEPHVVILDIRLGNVLAFELCRKIRRQSPTTRIVVLTAYDDPDFVAQAIAAGADGYFLKDTPLEDFKRQLREVDDGHQRYAIRPAPNRPYGSQRVTFKDFLSATDLSIIRQVSEGLTNKEIAQRHSLSSNTIKDRLVKIYRVFRVRSRGQLVAEAFREGII